MSCATVFDAAATFLYPVLHRDQTFKARGRSIIQCLQPSVDGDRNDGLDLRILVIRRALDLLLRIDRALKEDRLVASELVQDLSRRKTVDGLLDLVSLEGIYPSLSPGVGIPIERRVRSVLRNGVVTRPSPSSDDSQLQDQSLLIEICLAFDEILSDGSGIGPTIQQRLLVDVIAGFGELVYSPSVEDKLSNSYLSCKLQTLLDRTPASILYPALTSLLHAATPGWFRSPISAYLSLLPLRPTGVKDVISFLASSVPQGPLDSNVSLPDRENQALTPILSLEVITHASKLLSSVPGSISADTYFSKLAPQLLLLIDEKDVDAQRAAVYIVGNGILGRKKHGSPGTIGWKLFAMPIIEAFNPATMQGEINVVSEKTPSRSDLPPVLVSEVLLGQALNRLFALVLLHPNPGLTKRLIGPCVLSLWELLCYSQEIKKLLWAENIHKLLCTYFKTSVGINKLVFLGENLLWDEKLPWTYGAGTAGGIEIRKRVKNFHPSLDLGVAIERADLRIGKFMKLLGEIAVDDDIGVLFTQFCKNWLLSDDRENEGKNAILETDSFTGDPLKSLVNAKLTQEILKEYKDQLSANPKRVIELLSQIFTVFINKYRGKPPPAPPSEPSLAALENITISVSHQNKKANSDETSKEDSSEIISIALSLLSAILSSSEFSLDPETFRLLKDFQSNLANVTSLGLLPTSLIMSAANISSLLDFHISLSISHTRTKTMSSDPYTSDRKEHHLALSYLTDTLPPVRAQGLSILNSLLKRSSPVIDIQSTTVLLQSLLQDEDEFIYLSAIKNLGLLAARHQKTVLRTLVEAYIDPDEKASLDVRIKTGEALSKTIESLGSALVGDAATLVGDAMITLAGRRPQKPKSAAARHAATELEETARHEAEEAWGGEIPSSAQDTEQESLTQILNGWQGPPGSDDLRVRASALSILGTCIENSLRGLGSQLISSALDVALSILALEPGPEAAILRRAAVLLILSLAKALDATIERGPGVSTSFGFERRTVQDVMDTLRRVEDGDADEIVRGHSGITIEALETFMEKSMMRDLREVGKGKGTPYWHGRVVDTGDWDSNRVNVSPDHLRKNGIENRPRIEELG